MLLTLVAIGITILAVVIAASIAPKDVNQSGATTTTISVLFVVVAALLQFAAGYSFSRSGRADPTLASAALRRLFRLGVRAHQARMTAEAVAEARDPNKAAEAIGVLSVSLSWLEEGIAESTQDWAEFHADTFRRIQEEST